MVKPNSNADWRDPSVRVPRKVQRFFVPSQKKDHVQRELQRHSQQMRDSGRTCMWVDDSSSEFCGQPSNNRCHLIPEEAILSDLADPKSGKVLEFRWALDSWARIMMRGDQANPIDILSADTFLPLKTLERGKGHATTGHYACKRHDDTVFAPIDVRLPDLYHRDVMMLSVFRTLLFVADIARGAQAMMYDPGIDADVRSHESLELRRQLADLKKNPPFSVLGPALGKFRDIWSHRRTTVSVTGRPIPFLSKLHFAACGLIQDRLQPVSVHPVDGDLHQLIVIQVGPELKQAKETRSKLESAAYSAAGGNSGIGVVCEIMRSSAASIAASIDSFLTLESWDRLRIQAMLGHNSAAPNIYSILERRPRSI